MTPDGCPADADLAAFNLGELSEARLDVLAGHVETCARCEKRLQALDRVSDGVITSLRGLAQVAAATVARTEPVTLPTQVGEYEILAELGRGGLGVVYRARHQRLGREAALKMLLGGQFAGRDGFERFQAEARAVAHLRHPNIVQLFDVGEHQGQPYFTMELLDGGSLSTHLKEKPQPPAQAARWLSTLARAVQHAHEQKIVHRDLKPSNVLFTADGQLKVCDFGVAKHLEGSDLKTRSGQLVGTPEYMAPEQASGQAQRVGPAADVYSLGALLYALLTGRPPFQSAAVLETLEQVRSRDPVSPSRLQPGLPRDLATICLKCLEKEPRRRYPSAAALADDLERFLEGKTIQARPTGTLERGWKWAKRRPAVAALTAAVVAVGMLGFVFFFWQWRRAEAKALESSKQQAELAFNQGLALCDQNEVGRGLLWLVRSLELTAESGADHLERAIRINLADWREQLAPRRAEMQRHVPLLSLAFDPAGNVLASAGRDRQVYLWDAAGDQLGPPLDPGPKLFRSLWITRLAFQPQDGGLLACGDTDGEVVFWDVTGRRPVGEPLKHPLRHTVWGLAFSPDGTRLVTSCDDGAVRWWDVATRRQLGEPLRHSRQVGYHTLALSPDGRRLVTGGVDERVTRWDVEAGKPLGEPLPHGSTIRSLAFFRDGRRFLAGTDDGRLRVWDVDTGLATELPRQGDGLPSVAVSPDDRVFATVTYGGVVRFWDTTTLRPVGQTLKMVDGAMAVAFHPKSGLFAIGQEKQKNGTLTLCEVPQMRTLGPPLPMNAPVHHVSFNSDGSRLLAGSTRGARWWDLANTGKAEPRMHTERYEPADRVLSLDFLRTYARKTDHVATAAAPDGRTVAITRWGGVEGLLQAHAEVWDSATGNRLLHATSLPSSPRGVVYSPDARRLLTWGADPGSARLWDAATLTDPRPVAQALETAIHQAVFAPDSHTLLLGCADKKARLWDVDRDEEIATKDRPTHGFPITVAAFQPRFDSARPRVVTGCYAGTVRLWDMGQGILLHDIRGNAGEITAAAFSEDGRTLLTSSKDGTARFWDTDSGRQLGPALRHTDAVLAVAFHPDRLSVATGTKDGLVWRWRVPATAARGSVEFLRLWAEVETRLRLDERGAVYTLTDEQIKERRARLAALPSAPRP